jgi:hypothetical protein
MSLEILPPVNCCLYPWTKDPRLYESKGDDIPSRDGEEVDMGVRSLSGDIIKKCHDDIAVIVVKIGFISFFISFFI